jgi:hypothetical protein
MVQKTLEFRGINIKHLEMYIEELGGVKISKNEFTNDLWSVKILSEDHIKLTSIIEVNSVNVLFSAVNETELENLIKKYRYKTTRVGG